MTSVRPGRLSADLFHSNGNGDVPYVSYNLINEPHQYPTVETWLPVATALCRRIRAKDPHAHIIVSAAPIMRGRLSTMPAHWNDLKDMGRICFPCIPTSPKPICLAR